MKVPILGNSPFCFRPNWHLKTHLFMDINGLKQMTREQTKATKNGLSA
jgi:hypothetical protein